MLAPFRKLFEKMKIGGYEELKPHEKVSYDRWETMLTAETKTEDIKKYLNFELIRLRELREEETAIPGDRVDNERLAQIRTIKGMLGQYAKTENLRKQAEVEIEQIIKNVNNQN